MNKIYSNAGETIAETLVALLISTLALVMLAGAISTSFRIITRSNEVMNEYYSDATGERAGYHKDWKEAVKERVCPDDTPDSGD